MPAFGEGGRPHGGVVHAGNGQRHGRRRRHQRRPPPAAEGEGQGQVGRPDGKRHRQGDRRRVVRHGGVHPHRRHAQIVHGGDADTHGGRGQREAGASGRPRGDQRHRQADRQDGGERRDDRHQRVVADRDGQPQRQHADEMHGPDAGAEGERRRRQQEPAPKARFGRDSGGQDEADIGPLDRRHHRQQNERGIILPDQPHPSPVPRCAPGAGPDDGANRGNRQRGIGVALGGCPRGRFLRRRVPRPARSLASVPPGVRAGRGRSRPSPAIPESPWRARWGCGQDRAGPPPSHSRSAGPRRGRVPPCRPPA